MSANKFIPVVVLLTLAFAVAVFAAVPTTINYQGYLKNTDGTPVNSEVSVVFSLYTSASGGSALWSETRSLTPVNGVYSVQLGSVVAFPAGLFGNDTLWLGVKVGRDQAEMTPRQQLTTVPYAFRAATADSLASATWSQIVPVAARFVLVMGNAAVLDNETGLVWQRSTDLTPLPWESALYYCYQLSLGGRRGWRLPSVDELSSLVDPGQSNPALPAGHPFTNVQSALHWTSTTNPYAFDPDSAWSVFFANGSVNFYGQGYELYVRCVRGGK